MLLKIVYLLTCRVLGLAVLVFRGDLAKDAELLVLRYQNAVLRRHVGRVRYLDGDFTEIAFTERAQSSHDDPRRGRLLPEGELMAYKDMFTVLVVDSRIERSQSLRDAFQRILGHLRDDHHLRTDVLGTTRDAIIRLRNDASVACLLLEWGGKADGINGQRVLDTVADIGLDIPVFLLALADDLARELEGLLADVVRGLIYPEEDAPDFVARYVNRHFEAYIERLRTPFFGRIVDFNESSSESSSEMWTCPGHNGGMFYRRSPVGRVFYEYLGETVFRTDLDNSVVDLGDLLVHEGPAREAEAAAAEVFGADRTYFVLAGTSASNKVAAGALVARGDLVLFDRNSHKSAQHGALVLAGGIPVYLPADRKPAGPDRADRPRCAG